MVKILNNRFATRLVAIFILVAAQCTVNIFGAVWNAEERRLLKQCESHIGLRNFQKLPEAGRRLYESGVKSGNREAADFGLAYRLYGIVVSYSPESAVGIVKEAENRMAKLSAEAPSLPYVHLVLSVGCYYYICENDYNRASREILKSLGLSRQLKDAETELRALSLLSSIYCDRGDEEGMKWVRQCENVAQKIANPSALYISATNMASYLYQAGKPKEAWRYLMRADSIAVSAGMDNERFYIDSFIADLYDNDGDYKNAEKYYRKALYESEGSNPYSRWYAGLCYGCWLNSRGRHSEAVPVFEKAEKALEGFRMPVMAWHSYMKKAESLEKLGRYKEAFEALRKYSELSAERTAVENERVVKELEMKYNVAEREMENDRQKMVIMEKRRTLTVISAVCAVLIAVLIAGCVVYYRSIRYYRRIVNLNLSAISREKHLRKELAKALEKREDTDDASEGRKSGRADEIFLRLEKLMEEECAYRDSSLSLDALAAKVGTNRTYLQEAIRHKTGLTYSGYINELRINYAIEQLTSSDSSDVIKTLAAASGFESASNFYRQFKKKTGVSPVMFRQQSLHAGAGEEAGG